MYLAHSDAPVWQSKYRRTNNTRTRPFLIKSVTRLFDFLYLKLHRPKSSAPLNTSLPLLPLLLKSTQTIINTSVRYRIATILNSVTCPQLSSSPFYISLIGIPGATGQQVPD